MSNELDKLRSLDENRAKFIEKAHRALDFLFLASFEQKADSVTSLEDELDTYLEIIWRYDGKRAEIMRDLEVPDVIPDIYL